MPVPRSAVLVFVCLVTACAASPARAQAPPSGPLVLRLPVTPRVAALGNAWVAGSDREVIFYNPAQIIGARAGFDLPLIRTGAGSTLASVGSTFAAGKWGLTLGWGAELLRFSTDPATSYPLAPDVLVSRGSADGVSSAFAVGGAVTVKGFRIGASGKYAFDSTPVASGPSQAASSYQGVLMADIGVARNKFGGTFAGSVQNLAPNPSNGSALVLPKQTLVGWSTSRPAGPLDLGIFTQLMFRHDWQSAGGGLEAGYSWIEGYNVTLRVGAHRPEVTTEKPVALGAAFTADRLTIEYSLQLFDGGHAAHGVTFRWR